MKLPELYKIACEHESDINEHLPVLRDHASDCRHVTQIGARAGISTIAFLMANPAILVDWDVDPNAIYFCIQKFMSPPGLCGQVMYQPRVGNSLEFEIEETDLLFIDSWHTYTHLKAELERHGDKARRYIICHDTETFGLRGEDGKEPGLKEALREFQIARGLRWSCALQLRNNNGLVVLERRDGAGVPIFPFMRPIPAPNPPRKD